MVVVLPTPPLGSIYSDISYHATTNCAKCYIDASLVATMIVMVW